MLITTDKFHEMRQRQVGKTTLLKEICTKEGNISLLNSYDFTTPSSLENVGEIQLR